ncbi:hypothetical protein HHL16_16610 [Pseudoflavitalea sp. G-6-1-2]|uniref:hypothetical protein n=1 Tax=Pseudoflavitalea sp. G-6-1-2 TaxID=2728841 RepID=UPI001469AFEE|nr:hypothetical protein [Pseudoflavitalea sp. G-6-1-2]NML22507.1 hypothetical protein [Pseudoflavitalea sp. G-6-1-2]
MVRRKEVSIHRRVIEHISAIASFIKNQGLAQTALKFINDIFDLFSGLSEKRVTHRLCSFPNWRQKNYRCATFRKKYSVAYLDLLHEIIVSDFAVTKYLVSK